LRTRLKRLITLLPGALRRRVLARRVDHVRGQLRRPLVESDRASTISRCWSSKRAAVSAARRVGALGARVIAADQHEQHPFFVYE
jgi:hypothetical protein